MPHQGLLHAEPFPCSRPLLTHTSTGDTQTQFWLSLRGVSEPWCAQGFVCALKNLFPQLWKFWQLYGVVNGDLLQEGLGLTQVCCTQSPCPCDRPLLTHTSAGDTQTQFWLSLCGVSGSWCIQGLFEPSECLWQIKGLILNTISPLLPSCWGISFALGLGVSFFGGVQRSPVDGCSAVSCNFGVLTGEDECISFYPAILES